MSADSGGDIGTSASLRHQATSDRGEPSGRLPVIELEDAAETLTANQASVDAASLFARFQDSVLQALVRAFPVIMCDEFEGRSSQRGLAEWNQSTERFVFQTPEEPLDVRRTVRTPWRQQHDLQVDRLENHTKSPAELRVS